MNTSLRITVKNTSDAGGTALTPFFAGFHDNSFDLYNLGEASSAGLEALAEDGNNSVVAGELTDADADAQSTNVVGDRGPIAAGERADAIIDVDGASNGYLSLASMVLPSNDAFVGTADAVRLFDSSGRFTGAQTIVFTGDSVRDAGTEYNTEQDAAFINQTAPNTGLTEGGVVRVHEGFNGSAGNPDGALGNPDGTPGATTILGGTNAFGDTILPDAADFTLPGAQIAEVHINTVVNRDGTNGRDVIFGRGDDDIVDAGAGNDFIFSSSGWDVIDAGNGHDVVFSGSGDDEVLGGAGRDKIFAGSGDDLVFGGEGNDRIYGGTGDDRIAGDAGRDKIFAGSGNDEVSGGTGNDWISGGRGDDVIAGGQGRDDLHGGSGDDVFVFSGGDGRDTISDFNRRSDDTLSLTIEGVDSFDDVLSAATESRSGVSLDFGDGDSILLRRADIEDLSADDFIFG